VILDEALEQARALDGFECAVGTIHVEYGRGLFRAYVVKYHPGQGGWRYSGPILFDTGLKYKTALGAYRAITGFLRELGCEL
jgi:hypothetical protein